jgi:hypothetical protein
MMLIKLVIASLLIPIGFLFGLEISTEYINPKATRESQWSAVTAGVLLGLPAIAIGTGLVWQEYTKLSRKLAAKQRRIHAIFNDLLSKNNGIINVTSLMQSAHLSSKEAQKFLEKQAALWEKSSKLCQDGEIYYCFYNKSY